MRFASSVLLSGLAALGCLAVSARAQQPVPAPHEPMEQKAERIHHEDAGSRIDELRIGGETRNITVQPKGDVPPYEVGPQGNNRNPADSDRNRSQSGGWKLFGF